MRRLFLRDCAPGDLVEDVFIITNKQLAATSSGKYFIKAFCSDRTSQVTSRIWNATREMFASIPDGGFLRVRGRIENYQNNLQLIIEQMWPAKDGTFELADLMPHTERDVDEMCQRLFEMCGSIRNRHLRALLQAYLDDEELMNNFTRAPAAMNFHHAFVGGLLEHTLNAMEVGDAICKFYPTLSRDLVVAGIFLHDLAKTWELSYDSAFGYTDGGHLVGHIVKGAIWVEKKALAAEKSLGEPIPQPLIDVLQHIILSHHGEPEFGAAKVPATPEAIVVHTIENLDAKLMMALSITRGDTNAVNESNWTEYQKAFNGKLYRPDVALPNDSDSEVGVAQGEVKKPVVSPGTPATSAVTSPSTSPSPTSASISRPQQAVPRSDTPSRTDVTHHPDKSKTASPVAPQRDNRPPDKRDNIKLPPEAAKAAITNPLFESVPTRKH